MADEPVLLVTGASAGIGAATARLAVESGWRVVLGARREERLAELARELGGDGAALAVRCDVGSWEDQQALVARGLEGFGRVDATFANAGFGAPRGFLESDPEHWRAMIDTNVLGAALTVRAVLGHFRDQGRGHVVLTGSVAGRRALPGSLYSATKFAVASMAEGLRLEVRRSDPEADIRVTLISPGMVETEFFDEPPENALTGEDIARAVLYALEQPAHVDVNEILVRPTRQAN